MHIDLELKGADADENTTLALQDWIRRERVKGLQVERAASPAKEGQMGVDPVTILSVVLGAKAVVELVKSIHVWIEARKPKLKLKLDIGGSVLEIDAANLPDQQVLVEQALELVERSGKSAE